MILLKTSSALDAFFHLMMLYPEIQIKGAEELDRVVGRDRLPESSDELDLPYINAICHELLRLHPTAPFGILHTSIADDEYQGMFIPKGTLLVGNIRCVLTRGVTVQFANLNRNPNRRTERVVRLRGCYSA